MLTAAMIAAFERAYAEAPETIQFADGIMAAHNLHKKIVLDVIARANPNKHQRYALLAGVRETWVRAMDAEIKRKADG